MYLPGNDPFPGPESRNWTGFEVSGNCAVFEWRAGLPGRTSEDDDGSVQELLRQAEGKWRRRLAPTPMIERTEA
jgi:hypothetical protein